MSSSSAPTNVRRNMGANITDAAFFGFGLALSSFSAVIPLYIAMLTESTVLVGLASAAHDIGWQLPQLFTAGMVARRRRYLPFVLFATIHERWPYLIMALAAVGLAAGVLDKTATLIITFIMIWWHSLGGGLTATAWQSMISKIMPENMRGTFYGIQSAVANLMGSISALLGGVLLANLPEPLNFAACFFISGIAMMISMGFLAATKEEEHEPEEKVKRSGRALWAKFGDILSQDGNFRSFLLARILAQLALMPLSFYAVYGVRDLGVSPAVAAGVMISVMTISQTVAAPLIGRLGDIYGHRKLFILSNVVLIISAIAAILIRDVNLFALVFMLAGIVRAGQWTTMLAMTAEFGTEANRPYYIGLSNTSVAPATLFAPMLGGWLADTSGFHSTFNVSIVIAIAAILVILLMVREPRKLKREEIALAAGFD